MNVTIRLHAELRRVFGRKEVGVSLDRDMGTIREAIGELLSADPSGGHAARLVVTDTMPGSPYTTCMAISQTLIVLINDVDFKISGGLDAPLRDGDVVTLIPTIHGG